MNHNRSLFLLRVRRGACRVVTIVVVIIIAIVVVVVVVVVVMLLISSLQKILVQIHVSFSNEVSILFGHS